VQEVTSFHSSPSTGFDQLRSCAQPDISSQPCAFADFMGSVAQPITNTATDAVTNASQSSAATPTASPAANLAASPVNSPVSSSLDASTVTSPPPARSTGSSPTKATADAPPAPPLVQADKTGPQAAAVTTVATVTATATVSPPARTSATLDKARNTPVSREAFEKSKTLLHKAGLSDTEIADLGTRVQQGTLTWGQLVQTLGNHTTDANKTVPLSASENADLQSLFQKLGFASSMATEMVQSISQGDSAKVLATIQNKLSSQPGEMRPSLTANELSAFFKALRLPTDTAAKLTKKLGNSTATVTDLKGTLAIMSRTLEDRQIKASIDDTTLAKGLALIMEKDVDKSVRDTDSSSTAAASASGGLMAFDLKPKDKHAASLLDESGKTSQKSSDATWRNFLGKVRASDANPQQGTDDFGNDFGNGRGFGNGNETSSSAHAAAHRPAKENLEAVLNRSALSAAALSGTAQQATTDATLSSKAYDHVAAPKVLDQVTQALLKDLGQGRKQLTIELDPENLGKVQVMLQVKGKEVSAVISAEDSSTAAMLHSNMDGLKKSLEDKGLTVQNMQVQTGLTSRQDQQAAFNAEQHNQAQEQQDMSRIFSQLRMMRSDLSAGALDMQDPDMQAILSDQGLHLIA
jgi:flagellar hook-length control protein FliK